ncbi:single-stranded DNA-binding protein [Desulfohalobium retbaense]|uniref:Single-stranded DNA-binding protein n=1 Tax=Desulfohalobium retbaense (strain ATCC 49708 / DSM 5692 / JCM 16813 / HR100) TaxID=485915 RepID=C8X289_DESRD|nr:single-stranded DNA-binding protein [Desulfohalobium retbaense]ACV68412.1 single-strand binding protein [Desulfohalobium retbaense DSM 5692]
MAGTLNKVIIVGRLGRDPEVRYTQNGTPVGNLNVATDESFNDQQGQRQERTEWHRIVIFGRQAENCKNYLRKGSQVLVEGSLQTRKWQDQQGQDRYSTEIKALRVQFLDSRGSQQGGGGQQQDSYSQAGPPQQQSGQDQMGPAFPSEASAMDDIPF